MGSVSAAKESPARKTPEPAAKATPKAPARKIPEPAAKATPKAPARKTPEAPAFAAKGSSPRELFDELAPRKLRPLIHLILELKSSDEAPSAWADRCAASLEALRPLAAKLDDRTADEAIGALLSVLAKLASDGRPTIEGEHRSALLHAYAELGKKVPAAVAPDAERGRRELALVDALLLQVEGAHGAAIHKVYAAGWNATDRFLRATPEQLDRETGVGPELAERIVMAFRDFRHEFPTWSPEPSKELTRLAAHLSELRMQQAAFEQAAAGFSDADLAARRSLRRDRVKSLQRIYALLARLGEVERITRLDRLPYQAKIAEVADYLSTEAPSAASVS